MASKVVCWLAVAVSPEGLGQVLGNVAGKDRAQRA